MKKIFPYFLAVASLVSVSYVYGLIMDFKEKNVVAEYGGTYRGGYGISMSNFLGSYCERNEWSLPKDDEEFGAFVTSVTGSDDYTNFFLNRYNFGFLEMGDSIYLYEFGPNRKDDKLQPMVRYNELSFWQSIWMKGDVLWMVFPSDICKQPEPLPPLPDYLRKANRERRDANRKQTLEQ